MSYVYSIGNIKQFSSSKVRFEGRCQDLIRPAMEAFLSAFIIKDVNNNRHHWCHEVYAQLNPVDKVIKKGKQLYSYENYRKALRSEFDLDKDKHTAQSQIDRLITKMCSHENISIVTRAPEVLLTPICADFCDLCASFLSNKDIPWTDELVETKIVAKLESDYPDVDIKFKFN